MTIEPRNLQILVAGYASDPPGSQKFLKIDGVVGPATIAALRRFQRAHGLVVTGTVNSQTEAKLRAQVDYGDTSSAHFEFAEFMSKDGAGFSGGKVPAWEVKRNVRRLMHQLEALRHKCGGRAIIINSAFRSIARNNATPGAASNSMHLFGCAADITVVGMSSAEAGRIARTCGLSGLKVYNTATAKHLHGDNRAQYPAYGSPAWWWIGV